MTHIPSKQGNTFKNLFCLLKSLRRTRHTTLSIFNLSLLLISDCKQPALIYSTPTRTSQIDWTLSQ